MFFILLNPSGNKHERAKKADILSLVIIPKLLMKIDNTPITKILKMINGKIILFRFFTEFIIPLVMKNKRKYQRIISGRTKRYLLSSNCHGKGPMKAYIKDKKVFSINVTGFPSPVFIVIEELLPCPEAVGGKVDCFT